MKFGRLFGLFGVWLAPAVAVAAPPHKPAEDSPSLAIDQTQEMTLAIGENKTIQSGDVKSYSEGAPGIADVKVTPDGAQFIVVGQKPGATTLLLIKKDGSQVTWNINVFARPVAAVATEIGQLLDGTTGVRVRRVGSRFFIEGGVSSEPELRRIEHIASLYPGQVESLVVVGGAAADRRINIRIDFFFVQYDREKSYAFGMDWPATLGGGTIVQSTFSFDFLARAATDAHASIVNQPLPALDIASHNGWAKVLKQATVITSNGSEANFSSGGEQNYQISSGLTTSIQRIAFGTDVTVLPRFDPDRRELEVKVKAEVTDLTPPAAATTLPGRDISNLGTDVALKLGQSLVVSGIRTRSRRHDTSGIPLLSEIPILGALFGSTSDTKSDIEGAIFIVPSVIESAPENATELIEGAAAQYDRFDGDMRGVSSFDPRPPVTLPSSRPNPPGPSTPRGGR
jgi:pilus assembly protein CpaC